MQWATDVAIIAETNNIINHKIIKTMEKENNLSECPGILSTNTVAGIQTAEIGSCTRELLSVMAMFIDANESFNNWVQEHGFVSDDNMSKFANKFSAMYYELDNTLTSVIFEHMNHINFKDI